MSSAYFIFIDIVFWSWSFSISFSFFIRDSRKILYRVCDKREHCLRPIFKVNHWMRYVFFYHLYSTLCVIVTLSYLYFHYHHFPHGQIWSQTHGAYPLTAENSLFTDRVPYSWPKCTYYSWLVTYSCRFEITRVEYYYSNEKFRLFVGFLGI